MLAVALYADIAGASGGVVQVQILGGFSVFSIQIDRHSNGLNRLLLVTVLLVLYNPHVRWDVGFQLSFAAALGWMSYTEP